jgi:putative membrane protein
MGRMGAEFQQRARTATVTGQNLTQTNSTMKTRSLSALTALLAGLAFLSAQAKDPDSVLNSKDEGFVKSASQMGMAEVQLGMLGSKKAAREDVKALAEKMVTDHTAMNDELKGLAAAKKVMVSVVTDPGDTENLKDLENKTSGEDFDKAFLDQLEKDHKKSISAFEEASKDGKDGEVKAFAEKHLPHLRAHLDEVKKAQEKK